MTQTPKATKQQAKRSTTPKDQSSQAERFIETARELGCDEDEAAFDEKLRRIATAKPKRPRSPGRSRGEKSE